MAFSRRLDGPGGAVAPPHPAYSTPLPPPGPGNVLTWAEAVGEGFGVRATLANFEKALAIGSILILGDTLQRPRLSLRSPLMGFNN